MRCYGDSNTNVIRKKPKSKGNNSNGRSINYDRLTRDRRNQRDFG